MAKVFTTDDGKEIKVKKRHHSKNEKIAEYAFLAPSLIGLMIFFILPFFVIIYYSGIDNIVNAEFVGLDNFTALLHNSAFLDAAKNTATFSAIAVPLAVVISLIMAVILEKEIPMRSQFRTFFLSPMMVPVASVVLIWQVLFDHHGVINEVVNFFGGTATDWLESDYSQLVIVILFLWKNLGYNMILFMSALNAIPKDVLEVATLDSASVLQQFRYIKLRYLSSTILFVAIMSLINSFKVFREVYLLTGDYPYDKLYMLQHFMNNTFQSLNYQKLSAAAIIMALVMCVVIGALFYVENWYGRDVEG
ncbi:MAG: sugar ABC transporter permease [Lachnospiraceae bacterium]|nr:sugar ABC transporter permease [Lachnospiraceae bacterium]